MDMQGNTGLPLIPRVYFVQFLQLHKGIDFDSFKFPEKYFMQKGAHYSNYAPGKPLLTVNAVKVILEFFEITYADFIDSYSNYLKNL